MHSPVVYNPTFWGEIFQIEKDPFIKNHNRKKNQVSKWQKEIDFLMIDPITNEEKITSLIAKRDYVNQDISLSENLLNASDCLTRSFIETVIKMLDAHQTKEFKYVTEIRRLRYSLLQMKISLNDTLAENINYKKGGNA